MTPGFDHTSQVVLRTVASGEAGQVRISFVAPSPVRSSASFASNGVLTEAVLFGPMAKKIEVVVLSPSAVLKTGAPDTILALGKRGDRILAASGTSIYEWSEQGQLLRALPSPLTGGHIEAAAFSAEGIDCVLSRMGGRSSLACSPRSATIA